MSTVVFIHGTGVREPAFGELYGRFSTGLKALRPSLHVVPYYWGEAHGATLAAQGACLPPSSPGTARTLAAQDPDDEAWGVLYADPHTELALAAAAGPTTGELAPGSVPPGHRIRHLLDTLGERLDPDAGELACLDGPALARQAALLASQPLLGPASLALDPAALAEVVARALVAAAVRDALAADDPLIPTGEQRDRAVDTLGAALGAPAAGSDRGPRRWLLHRMSNAVVRRVERGRRPLTEAAHPTAGDILRYLARGEPFRAGLAALALTTQPPVTFVGHSLGGIIALETLISRPLPMVRLVVTAGSQAPFLYETGALPTLAHPAPLPAHVPPWLNFYDPRDLLAHVGAELFPGRVDDHQVLSRQPFPAAHSAYWTNPAVYRRLEADIP